ncbi:YafY family protein [Wukongibacter baidiensis]|uniref:helix-turn-helix transcriptional regulator n=1 Tax=Wukongibacter baidiensis TaxID=1723361 RepID=UPI003D7FFD9B
MKIDRLLGILMILINRKKVTANELAEYFEVSIRTIQRDMDTLNMAGIPIYADVGKNGGYQLLDNYKLNKNFLNENEAKVLITFLENLEKTMPYADVKSVFNKFSSLLPKLSDEEKIVIKLNPLIDDNAIINKISSARDSQHKVLIKYIDINLIESDRIISPYTAAMMGSTWYIYAYCDLREDFRLFKLNRIISCEILKETFELKETPEVLPWDDNLDSKRENVNIILEVDKVLQGRIPEAISYKDCRIEKEKIIIELAYPVDEWLYSLLAGLIPYVRIVKPDWLREEFTRRLIEGIEKNK